MLLANNSIECTSTNAPNAEAELSPRASRIIVTKLVPEISTWSANAHTLLPIPNDLLLETARVELIVADDIKFSAMFEQVGLLFKRLIPRAIRESS